MAYILAGVSYNRALNQQTGAVIFTTKTTQENGMSITVTEEEIRGGMSNLKLGSYFHDSALTANITDALFDLEYVAQNIGSVVSVGADVIASETVTTTAANSVTVLGTPVAFLGLGTIGWVSVAGADKWQKVTFVGKTAPLVDVPQGTKVCVKYSSNNASARQMNIPAAIIPNEVIWEMHYPLFKGTDASYVSSSQVGELIVTVPRFLFSGSQDLNITSSGAATVALSGSALASFSGADCNDMGQYATMVENIYGKEWYDGLVAMSVEGADVSMTTGGGNVTLSVTGIYENGELSTKPIDNANLTFVSGTTATCTVGGNTGVVTPVAVGNSMITITATNKPSIACYAYVTVT